MLISLFGWLTSKIVFPFLYPFRNTWVRNVKPFWYYFDDEDEFGFNVHWWMVGRNKTFLTAYKWAALRNPAWNLQASLKPKQGAKEYVSHKGNIGSYNYYDLAVLKYVDQYSGYMDNKGEYLSLKYSIIGKMFTWYKIDSTLYWRYSFAGKLFRSIWCEIQLGTTDIRYTFRFKIKKVKLL